LLYLNKSIIETINNYQLSCVYFILSSFSKNNLQNNTIYYSTFHRNEKLKAIENKIKDLVFTLIKLYETRYIEEKYEYLPDTYHMILKNSNREIRRRGHDSNILYYVILYEINHLHPSKLIQLL